MQPRHKHELQCNQKLNRILRESLKQKLCLKGNNETINLGEEELKMSNL